MYMERPPYPGNRLDVQRHYLEDKRAGYAFMNPDPRDDGETGFSQVLHAVRGFVTRSIGADRQQPGQVSPAPHTPVAGTVETAEPV